ncbi:hypothetical protein J2W56_003258 [Nocardia kruczakiae]|uniref:Uncharacterized protein n=1 Tax=Nocardia kruczakiae TaxID=261477 RepID=A0ABU1XHS2_9NOCA|nr:hypothetical protein [Nocardia kruczakiae]MDR7169517.1 hypothetical protein [Nocardia kruczakiae]
MNQIPEQAVHMPQGSPIHSETRSLHTMLARTLNMMQLFERNPMKRLAVLAVTVAALGIAPAGIAGAETGIPLEYNNTDEITANQPVVLHTGSTVIDLLAYIGAGCVGSWSPAPPAYCVG